MGYTYSKSKREYRRNGRPVTDASLRGYVVDAQKEAKAKLRSIGQDLLDKKINRTEWAIRSGEVIKDLHRSTAMLAHGGREQMDARKWGQLGGRLREQFSYFNRFAAEVDNKKIEDLGNGFLSRLESYHRAAHRTYQDAILRVERAANDNAYEQRHLGAAVRHCGDCLTQADLGPQPPGVLKPIGVGCECDGGCKCYFTFIKAAVAAA